MKLSIIICTFNRALQLDQLLEDLSFQHSRLTKEDRAEIEVILVDNNSYDNTKEIAYKYTESTSMKLKYFTEDRLGLAFARNHAIKQASGDLLAFLHDDITLDEDWLKEVVKISNICSEKEIGVYGGHSIPLWQDRSPAWFNAMRPPYIVPQELFSGHSYGDAEAFYPVESGAIRAEVPLGVNFLIRREIFENCGDFRTDLGPNGGGEGFALYEDYEFFEYLQTLQIPMLYVPQCIVFHPVSPEQIDIPNIRRWYFKSGRALYWIQHTDRVRRQIDPFYALPDFCRTLIPRAFVDLKISTTPLYLYLKLLTLFFWWLIEFLTFNQSRRYWITFIFSKTLGEISASQTLGEIQRRKKFTFKDRLG